MLPFLTDHHLEWKEKARALAENVVRPIAREYDEAQEYPTEVKDALAKEGFMGLWISPDYGGSGSGLLTLCVCVEELSRACGGIGVAYAVNALGSFPIIVAGTEDQKKRYLPGIATGETLTAFGLSEKFAGSDAGSIRSTAVKDGDEYIINGEKKWTTNGGVAHLYSVFAVTDPESKSRRTSAFIVPKGTPGFEFGKTEDKMGIRAAPVRELRFTDCRVPAENLIGGQPGLGFKHAMMTLDHARPGVAAQAVGLAQGALEYATYYATKREQFGGPISSFQMIQQMLAEMSAKVDAARYLVYAAADALERKLPNTSKLAAEAKLLATDTAMEVTTNAVQIFGGYGFMKDYPIEKYMRDAKITQIYEGTNQVQRLVIARALVKEASQLSFLDPYIPKEVQKGVND
ncbi:acyl-CoA dehydrogenase [candidate division TA06 bacterium DG_24]|uniref:Acyl-CoA dehydrogenase n=1 Tax=candidate division TA06 bacterium DG_24 TaxID=1703770 RepID=A0A0S7WRF5_UNCT6|nr:MAG: acyl-CoA dehydrogenase [candidate division TA06 bacterium DG_24]